MFEKRFKELVDRLLYKGVAARQGSVPKGYNDSVDDRGIEVYNKARLYVARSWSCALLDWEAWELKLQLPFLAVRLALHEGEQVALSDGKGWHLRAWLRRGRLYHKLHDLLYGFRHDDDEIPF
jgi:hypothetical protein